jgi:hypothetical protein
MLNKNRIRRLAFTSPPSTMPWDLIKLNDGVHRLTFLT